ncbi:MAG: aconitate hydratase AcnA [Alphaproteobacteria bacterium CG11_big_fil_rev_8_21_14_0_20_39_49]|nr:MAG: aconitate hydratase AcnA [Alphaproteobacteria bacterium CG11_big_fil_rev_8_21_14_0_20_39_49]
MNKKSIDSFSTKSTLTSSGREYSYYSIKEAEKSIGNNISRLPFSLKVLLENLLRYEDGDIVKSDDIKAFSQWIKDKKNSREIAYRPARVLMQDFTGVPAVVDLAAMRDAMKNLGGDPKKINPLSAVDLVIDHSVMVDKYGTASSFEENVQKEFERNRERYEFLKWGQKAFNNFRVVPPGTGICHQVNLEYLAKVVWSKEIDGETYIFPDTVVGTDSHTTMINGLAVLGWGVGGIEAEAAMLGQPVSMLIPEVVGFKLTGTLKEGTTATDVVLTVTQMLRAKGVVGKFVEYFGSGLSAMPLADRATLANMAPEYGATCGFFPIDKETIKYMKLSSRDAAQIQLVEDYAKAQGMWYDENSQEPVFTDILELDLGDVEPCISGPKRPQDKINLASASSEFKKVMSESFKHPSKEVDELKPVAGDDLDPNKDKVGKDTFLHTRVGNIDNHTAILGKDYEIRHGDVTIAAITSCTNTSNPSVMIAAGLVAKKAAARGIKVKPWVKTSLAPGSKVVTEYLEAAGLDDELDKLGFNLVGYGCTTCIGNSGPLLPEIEEAVKASDITVCSVLSGNRNFEGRVHALVKANYLASPPLVVAYAIAGSMNIDITKDAIANDNNGNDVYLKDIWPTNAEIADAVLKNVTPQMFAKKYADVFAGDEHWQKIKVEGGDTYAWSDSTYINNPPYFTDMKKEVDGIEDVKGASILAIFGDSITTDHISPAGSIAKDSPAAKYLKEKGVAVEDFNSYGSRRGNHEVMMRGTFANIRIQNEMTPEKTGGYTKCHDSGEVVTIYDFAMKKKEQGVPLVIFAGKDYGMGSSRDWAAKGTILLGVKAVISESFERIHRSNLVGMGVLPLNFKDGITRKSLNLKGDEKVDILGIEGGIKPGMDVSCVITRSNGETEKVPLLCRIDTGDEVEYYKNGGILHNVIRDLL